MGAYNLNIDKCLARKLVWLGKTVLELGSITKMETVQYSGVGSKIKVERPIVLVDSSGNVILKWGADYAEPDEIDPIVCEAHNRTCEAWSP